MRFLSRKLDSHVTNALGGASGKSVAALAGQGIRDRARRFAPLIVTLTALLLVGAGTVIGVAVRDSMRQSAHQSLRSILRANVAVLEAWFAEMRSDVARLQAKDAIDSATQELLDRHAGGSGGAPADLLDTGAYQTISRQLVADAYLGWAVLDDQRYVVASNVRGLMGKTLRIPSDAWNRLAQRSTMVSRPFKSPVSLTDQVPLSQPGAPLMCAIGPIMDGARPIGALALLVDPLGRFSELLSIARMGETGESYAIDRDGTLLSQSRFEHQLRAAGLLDSDPLVTSPLNLSVRDPEVDLTSGATASLLRDQQPLTWMADQATRGATSENVTGYNNYLGVPVIGAWRWLPEYGIGVTTEIAVAEVYRPFHILKRTFVGLVSLIALAGFGGLVFASIYRSLNDRFSAGKLRRLGQYELEEMVGRGGMGAVYRGRHSLLGREVAIKVLEGDEVNPQSVSRFQREVRMTARLRHPNTIDIYDYGASDGDTFFYVMEYIDGVTLQELVNDFGRQPPPRVIHLLLQICGSLSEAHQLGMIHRDIKPSNILLTARAGLYDMIKVLDFGLVKDVKEVNRDTVELTQSDGITGTPMYMSPEAVRDAATANQQSDLYSVGAVGYTLLTGLPTFEGDSSVDVCLKQLNEDPIRPSDRIGHPLPDDLQNVLMSCLRKQPRERPLSMDDLESALRQCTDAGRWSAADALRWWEVELPGSAEEAISEGNGGRILTGEESSSTTAK